MDLLLDSLEILIIAMVFMLYTVRTYPLNSWYNAFWLIAILWLGVNVLTDVDCKKCNTDFTILIIVFNTMIQFFYLQHNTRLRKKNE